MAALLSRRRMLAGMAALALAGCAPSRARGTSDRPLVLRLVNEPPGLTLSYYTFEYYKTIPHLIAAFNAAHTHVRIVPGSQHVRGPVSLYALQSVGANLVAPAAIQPLDAALKAANFDPRQVQPDFLQSYRHHNTPSGLPISQMPLAVRWRRDVFAPLRLSPPKADWSIDDFERVCQTVSAAIEGGHAPDLLAPLYPVAAATALSFGIVANPAFWMAFALGYGGSVVTDGRFAPDAGALQGLSVLVDIVRRYCPLSVGRPIDTTAGLVQLSRRFALAFDLWAPPGVFAPSQIFGAQWAWARLPRFPVRPVVTTLTNGEGLTMPPHGQQDPGQLDMAVEALLWLYRPAAQALLQAWGAVPVLAAEGIQKQFWSRQSSADQAVGDWRNFVPYDAGWPSSQVGWPSGSVKYKITNVMMGALSQAFRHPEALAANVVQAARLLNG